MTCSRGPFQPPSRVLVFVITMPSPERGVGHEAAQISRCARCAGCMAARRARAAAGDAGYWIPPQRVACAVRERRSCLPSGPERNRLHRGPECGDRISLGGRPIRSTASTGGRFGSPSGHCDLRRRPSCRAGGKGRNRDNSNCLRQRSGPGQARSRRQPQSARRQRNGLLYVHHHVRAEEAGATARVCSESRRDRRPCEPNQSQCRDGVERLARSGTRSD
jgi:hypothetical protein